MQPTSTPGTAPYQQSSTGDLMNGDKIKGALQRAGGHVEEAAGALVGDENLKLAGQEDQIKGDAREAWGNVKEAGDALIDRAKAAKLDAELKSERAEAFDREHAVEVVGAGPVAKEEAASEHGAGNSPGPMSKTAPQTGPDTKDGAANDPGPESQPPPRSKTA